ncbi:MAG: cation-translocating P-type ATPase [Bacteroidetes bacterium]|nr:cation-translocating P-type ATPase [Bacteroidota bacterium]
MELKSAHAKQWKEVLLELKSDSKKGLSSNEAERRLDQYGPNSLQEKKKVNPVVILIAQFKSPFVFLLIIAAGLSSYFEEYLDATAIGVVIVINAIIGFIMEYQAEQSMEALKKLTLVPAKVIRDGSMREILSDEVVPGDLMFVEAGDIVQADGRLISFSQFEIDESSLTGESVPVSKQLDALPEDTSLAERTNILYRGTSVTKGNGYFIVTSTGMQTELGKIAALVQSADAADTPLEKKIEQFSKKLIWITVMLVVLIFLAGVLYGHPLVNMLMTSIALAVAAIPEGLPIVATLALAQGMLRMARHNVIVKKLAAVETLGGTTVICTDKTGTLTQNRIEVNHIRINGSEFVFEPDALTQTMRILQGGLIQQTQNYEIIQLVSTLCNTAEVSVDRDGKLQEVGDPLETGLLKFVRAGKKDIFSIRKQYPKVFEEPFDSATKIMATCHAHSGRFTTYSKGGADEVLQSCTHFLEDNKVVPLSESVRNQYMTEASEMASSGLRVIAAAFKETDDIPGELNKELIFTGLIGMMDPPRNEVPEAIKDCKSAGVKVIMVTGDHPATAKKIGLKLGLLDSGQDDQVMHGNTMGDYEQLDAERKKAWLHTRIFARVNPKQKLDLVRLLQENNEVVGMTGDGVNDAPALKKADIGIAMGLRGTQVAQEVADMVLKDDSFSSIVVAIKQGRVIFDNIRKFIVFLLSCNVSELFLISMTSILNVHYALFPLQILYINIVTDVLPALALGVTKGSDSVMKQKPRSSTEPIIGREQWKSLIVYALVITIGCLLAVFFIHGRAHEIESWNKELCNNVLFITLIFSQLFHVLNMTSDRNKSFFKTDVARNKYVWYALALCILITVGAFFISPVADALRLDHLSAADWAVVIGFSLFTAIVNWSLKKLKVIV